jgi:predicted nucleic acid-binding protein
MTDAFDADVLIYAAQGHELGLPVLALFSPVDDQADDVVGLGSVLLMPELLAKPMRLGHEPECTVLRALLGRLDLQPVSRAIANLAVDLGSTHGLRAPDAIHLATAVLAGADRFITNNRRDFPTTIEEIDIVHPDQLQPG